MSPLVAVKPQPEIRWRVGKKPKPLSEYPFIHRWLIRGVYWLTGFQTTTEDVAIASSEEIADKMCLDEGYFYKPLYVDVALPPEQCTIGPVVWPRIERSAQWMYAHSSPDMVAITRHEFEALQGAVDGISRSAHA